MAFILYLISVCLNILATCFIRFKRNGYSDRPGDNIGEMMPILLIISFIPIINIIIFSLFVIEEINIYKENKAEKKKRENEINEFWECVLCDIRMRKGYLMKSKVENQCPICKENSSFLKVEKHIIPSNKILEHQYIKLKDFENDSLIKDMDEQERKYLEIMNKKLSEKESE